MSLAQRASAEKFKFPTLERYMEISMYLCILEPERNLEISMYLCIVESLHFVTTNCITWNGKGKQLSILKYILFYCVKFGNKRTK